MKCNGSKKWAVQMPSGNILNCLFDTKKEAKEWSGPHCKVVRLLVKVVTK